MPPPRNALERLQAQWEDNVEGFQDRIGWLASRVRTYAILPSLPQAVIFAPITCTMDEVIEYRAYIVHARMVGFLDEALADEALDDCATAEACITGIPPPHSR
jgi:hypothetical protein